MSDGFVQVPADSVGKKVDAASLDVGLSSVVRQRFIVADNVGTSTYATVLSAAPAGTEGGLVVRNIPSGTQTIGGQVSLAAGTANIGIINNISATVNVAFAGGISLAAGTANIGFINNISATVNVAFAGGISLAAGTANIGFLDSISRTVQVAIGTPFTVNNISAAVAVTGTVSLGAGTAVIGDLNAISRTVQVAIGTPFTLNNISATVVVAGEIANGASLSTTNKPVLMGGNTSAGGAGGLMVTLLLDTSGRPILGAGTNNIGAVSNAAGTANIGFINNISATVIVAGVVSLGAGAANIGFINNISATVIVAGVVSVGGAVNISVFPALVAGTANIGFINNISATVTIAGNVNISLTATVVGVVGLTAGTANIGFINNISANVKVIGEVAHGASVTAGDAPVQTGLRANFSAPAANISNGASFAWGDKFGRQVVINNHPSLLPTASHGPKVVFCSTSVGVALVAAPGAGLSVFITQLACTNGSGTLTRADVFQVSATASCVAQMYVAASGGGFVMKYDPPIQLLSNSGATCRVDPSVSKCLFNVHFYIGAK